MRSRERAGRIVAAAERLAPRGLPLLATLVPAATAGAQVAALATPDGLAVEPWAESPQLEITLDGERLELRVNGVLQNVARWREERDGPIALQSEGAVIHFRDIRLRPIVN